MRVSKWLLFISHINAMCLRFGVFFLCFFLIYLTAFLHVEYCKGEWGKDIFIHTKLKYLQSDLSGIVNLLWTNVSIKGAFTFSHHSVINYYKVNLVLSSFGSSWSVYWRKLPVRFASFLDKKASTGWGKVAKHLDKKWSVPCCVCHLQWGIFSVRVKLSSDRTAAKAQEWQKPRMPGGVWVYGSLPLIWESCGLPVSCSRENRAGAMEWLTLCGCKYRLQTPQPFHTDWHTSPHTRLFESGLLLTWC